MNRFDPKGYLQPNYATSANSSDNNPFKVIYIYLTTFTLSFWFRFGSLCRNSMQNAITIVISLRLYRIPVLLPVDSESCAPSF